MKKKKKYALKMLTASGYDIIKATRQRVKKVNMSNLVIKILRLKIILTYSNRPSGLNFPPSANLTFADGLL